MNDANHEFDKALIVIAGIPLTLLIIGWAIAGWIMGETAFAVAATILSVLAIAFMTIAIRILIAHEIEHDARRGRNPY